MKTSIFAILALASLSACTGNSSKQNSEGQEPEAAVSATSNEAGTSDQSAAIDAAVKLWNAQEQLKNYAEATGDIPQPSQYALVDFDKDGKDEILLREVIKQGEEKHTGFIAAFANGSKGLKLIGIEHTMAQIGGIYFFKNGMTMVSSGNESGTYGLSQYYLLKDSNIETVYSCTSELDEEADPDAEPVVTYSKSTVAYASTDKVSSEKIGKSDFESATQGLSYGDALETASFPWKDLNSK